MWNNDIPILKSTFEKQLNQILCRNFPQIHPTELMKMYDTCFKLCTHEEEKYIYDTIKLYVDNYCGSMKLHINTIFNDESISVFKDKTQMLTKDTKNAIVCVFYDMRNKYVHEQLNIFMIKIELIKRIGAYLERSYIIKAKKEPLLKMMAESWERIIADKNIKEQITFLSQL